MNKKQFQQFAAQGYNRIPVYKEILSDLDTPLTLFMKLANRPYSYLLESVQGGEQWARYSMIGLSCANRLEIRGHNVREIEAGEVVNEQTLDDPLGFIDTVMARYRVPEVVDGLPHFMGGLVGYFAYDVVRLIEPSLEAYAAHQTDTLGVPDVVLLRSEEVVVVDNLSGKAYLILMTEPSEAAYQSAQSRLNELLRELEKTLSQTPLSLNHDNVAADKHFSTSADKFRADIDKCKDYIVDGDAFQIVLSQRMRTDFDGDPLDLYRVLRTLNPSPYMYYLHLDDFHIVGASPEILVRYENGEAQVRPIAGTRPRGQTPAEDLTLEKELLADPKECAEHLMLIDLGRNDIGRIAKAGCVEVTEQMVIERYSHVMHIVSDVVGQVQDGKTAMDVFKAVFPAGTLSGAPKIRAMQIISELEPVKRNIYGGAIGYLSWNGDMDTAITIRTAVIKNGKLHVQAGAGVVYDSVAEDEWQETLNKAASVLTAQRLIDRSYTNPQK
ncbi:MAG: anthranilate synthase component I [Gammaproteobacteria bacterium]|nr:MAG: anthranilate synthase component I [Gammaproteobacteria bacterium]